MNAVVGQDSTRQNRWLIRDDDGIETWMTDSQARTAGLSIEWLNEAIDGRYPGADVSISNIR
jgi:hypothetical protein